MFTVKADASNAQVRIERLVPEIQAALVEIITADAQKLLDRADALASGGAVKVRTGKFLASIKMAVTSSPTAVEGSVYSNDPRASLFDWGGSQGPRDILPNVRQALHFMGSAGAVFAAVVHRPEVTYPPHAVIHAAFGEMESQIVHDIISGSRSEIIDMGG